MHFRVRKQVVQLVRMTYDPAIKRGRAEIIGSVPLSDPVLPDNLQAKLSAQERSEFETWVATQHRTRLLRRELAALSLAEQMDQARQWLEQQGDDEATRAVVDEWQRSWKVLRRTLVQRELIH